MENTKLKTACVLLLFLVLHQQVLFVQSRHLRSRLCRECSKPQENTMNIVAVHADAKNEGRSISITVHEVHQERSRRVQYEVDDFRPTSPGHSPGVGHSINN